jgi:hypothetical protein
VRVRAEERGNAVAEKLPEKRDEFQAFKNLTRRLVAVPKGEILRDKPKRKKARRRGGAS